MNICVLHIFIAFCALNLLDAQLLKDKKKHTHKNLNNNQG